MGTFWPALPFRAVLRSTVRRLHFVRADCYCRRRIFTLEMKRGEKDQLDGERSSKVVKLDATQPEEGPSSSPAEKTNEGAQRVGSGQKQKKKKNGRAWKGKDKNDGSCLKTGRRGSRRGDATPAEGEERSAETKAPRLPKRQCALMVGFCGTGYSGMQLYVVCTSTVVIFPLTVQRLN